MAQVPGISIPQVTPENVPQQGFSVNTNPRMFGAAMGEAEQHLGGAISEAGHETGQTAMRLLDFNQTTQALDADNQTYPKLVALDDQLKKLRGKDAVDAAPELRKQLWQTIHDTADNLPPMARNKFMESVAHRAFFLERGMADYADRQQFVYRDETYKSAITNAVNEASINANDPDNVAKNWAGISANVHNMAELRGGDENYEQQLLAHYGHSFDLGLVKNRGATNPRATIEQLKDPEMFPHLNDQERSFYAAKFQKMVDNGFVVSGVPIRNSPPITKIPDNIMTMIDAKADELGVPRDVARAVALQESGGRMNPPGSNDGGKAVGIFQLHEGAATDTGVDRNTTEGNIAGGVGYLAKLHKQFGSWDKAIAAYNAGPGAMAAAGGDVSRLPAANQQYLTSVNALRRVDIAQLMHHSSGNPMGQYSIAQDMFSLTPMEDDSKTVERLTGPAQSIAQQALVAKSTALSATGDPAGYLYNINKDLQSSVSDGLSGKTSPAGAGTSFGIGRAIKEADLMYDSLHQDPTNRPILSRDVALSVTGRITSLPPTEGLKMLEQMKGKYGDVAFTRIYTDLVRQGKLPVQYQVAMAMNDVVDRQQLMRAYTDEDPKHPGKDIPHERMKGMENTKGTIDAHVDNDPSLHTFLATFYNQGYGVQEADYHQVLKRLAYQKFREGASSTAAAADAISAVTRDYDTSMNSARIPMKVAPVVKANAQNFLDNLDMANITVPDYAQSPQHYAASLKGASMWITNKDETGLNLLDQTRSYVRDKNGVPVTIPFNAPALGLSGAQHTYAAMLDTQFATWGAGGR